MKIMALALTALLLSCIPYAEPPSKSTEQLIDEMARPVTIIKAKPSRWDGWFIVRDGNGDVHTFMNNYAYAFVEVGTVIRNVKKVR